MNTDKIVHWLFADRIPIVKLLIVSNVGTFVVVALFKVGAIAHYLTFSSFSVLSMPWSLVTYPLVGASCSPIHLLFAGYWMWVAGGSLERSWGSRTFGRYFVAMCVISALGLLVGGKIVGVPIHAAGLWLVLAGITVAFAMLNPEQQILFLFVIPLKLKYLAMLSAAFVLISYGQVNPVLGVFALSGLGFSYWYVRAGRQYGFSARGTQSRGEVVRVYKKRGLLGRLNPLHRMRERRERDELKKLFDRSGAEDDGTSSGS